MKHGKKVKGKTVLLFFVSVLLLSVGLPVRIVQTQTTRPDDIIVATVYEPQAVDPAWAYDTTSGELIFNVYDTLAFFYVNRTLPPAEQGRTDLLVPSLATEWSVESVNETDSDTGLTRIQRWYFKIRKTFANASGTFPVTFHNGDNLTCEDVEYSFERWMVQCRLGGPTWMILEPLLGVYKIRPNEPTSNATKNALMIKHAVERNSTHVWFNLVTPYAPFLSIMAQPWSSILNKNWCIAHGDWPGSYGPPIDAGANWTLWNNPEVSPLDDPEPVMCGSGPYVFDYWDRGEEWSLCRNVDYWGGWPAEGCNGYVDRVTEKFVPEWATRKMLFLAGDIDFCYVPKQHISELEGLPTIRCTENLSLLMLYPALFFNFNVSTVSPNLGPGFDPASPYTIAEDRIPINLFSDINVRKGFAYSFNYTKCIEDIYIGEAVQPTTCVIRGLPYYNSAQEKYNFNLTAAEDHFRAAWDGQVWTTGFTFRVIYRSGNLPRQKTWDILKTSVESLNPKFHIDVIETDWWYPLWPPPDWPPYLPMFLLGWLADYPDPHNFVHPFMHSEGDFVYSQKYSNPTVDVLVEEGVRTLNKTRRKEIYCQLQEIYYEDCPSVPLVQQLERHWERTCIQGWYYNPIYPGDYFYDYWKEYPKMEPVEVSIVDIEILPSVSSNLTFMSKQEYHGWT